MQTCKKCKKEKELSNYYIQPQTKNGREAICSECKRAIAKRSRERAKGTYLLELQKRFLLSREVNQQSDNES